MHTGGSPLVLSMPHSGTQIPDDITANLNDRGQAQTDCDWRVDDLYAPLAEQFDASTVITPWSRYVIDVNRDPSGVSLYPGQATTGLVPDTDFDGQPIWRKPVTQDEVERRKGLYFQPYHDALRDLLDRAVDNHGYAILYDCHSIRSHVPRLFDGELPVLNVGTNDGQTCTPQMQTAIADVVEQSGYSHVINGRFKGGWITRHYGDPANNIHAVQMELAQSAYLTAERAPWTLDEGKANTLRQALHNILTAICQSAATSTETR